MTCCISIERAQKHTMPAEHLHCLVPDGQWENMKTDISDLRWAHRTSGDEVWIAQMHLIFSFQAKKGVAEEECVLVRWLEKTDDLDELEAATELDMYRWAPSPDSRRKARGRRPKAGGRGRKANGQGRTTDSSVQGEDSHFDVQSLSTVGGIVCMQPHPLKPGVFFHNRFIA